MPIYEYECRSCHHQFEVLVLKGTVPACPECHTRDLERLQSGFAVNTKEMSLARVRAAKNRIAASTNFQDKRIAEREDTQEHLLNDHGVDLTRPLKPARPKPTT